MDRGIPEATYERNFSSRYHARSANQRDVDYFDGRKTNGLPECRCSVSACRCFCGTDIRSSLQRRLTSPRVPTDRCPPLVSFQHREQELRQKLPSRTASRPPTGVPRAHCKDGACLEADRTCRRG